MIIEFLWEHIVRPEYTVRFRWQEGDIAFWDNRSTAHVAPIDIFESEFDRQLYRITLVGDVPVGVDGRRSNAIDGRPILSAAELQPMRVLGMKPVGNYAYTIHFSDGHDTGIFQFDLLRELGVKLEG